MCILFTNKTDIIKYSSVPFLIRKRKRICLKCYKKSFDFIQHVGCKQVSDQYWTSGGILFFISSANKIVFLRIGATPWTFTVNWPESFMVFVHCLLSKLINQPCNFWTVRPIAPSLTGIVYIVLMRQKTQQDTEAVQTHSSQKNKKNRSYHQLKGFVSGQHCWLRLITVH